jgi:hypothetical protein
LYRAVAGPVVVGCGPAGGTMPQPGSTGRGTTSPAGLVVATRRRETWPSGRYWPTAPDRLALRLATKHHAFHAEVGLTKVGSAHIALLAPD